LNFTIPCDLAPRFDSTRSVPSTAFADIMKYPFLPAALLVPLTLTQCVVVEETPATPAPTPEHATQLPGAAPTPSYGQPLTVETSAGSVIIREGSRTVSSFRTALPNVEQTRWASEQEQIVVKSRGNHGPATVQLFNSRTGAELGRVQAYEIRGGQPGWAAGMEE
jgi:hypothetical protein